MTTTTTAPISSYWTSDSPDLTAGATFASAAQVTRRLALLKVTDIEAHLLPFLAAAAAEMTFEADIPWRLSTDDPAVALLRLIAKVAIMSPHVGGPHTARLLDQLR
ncbi:MAG: hypothetical protein WD691_06095 [Acidimicrobiales bacterium]